MTEYEKGYADGVLAAAAEAFAEAHHVGVDDPAWQANARAAHAIGKRIRSLAAPAAPKEEAK